MKRPKTFRSKSNKKLYPVRDSVGRFVDIQTYERAHRKAMRRKKRAPDKEDPNSKYWRNKADSAFSIFIRKRDGECLFCGSKENLHCAHIYPREMKAFRWKKWNAIALCAKHHKFSIDFSFHKNPIKFILWFMNKLPDTWKTVATATQGPLTQTYKEVYEELKEVNKQWNA